MTDHAARFTADDRRVIAERHFGWEKAPYALLAKVFSVHPNTIAAICRAHARKTT